MSVFENFKNIPRSPSHRACRQELHHHQEEYEAQRPELAVSQPASPGAAWNNPTSGRRGGAEASGALK